ncbi:MAG: hypothetical protein ACKO5I_04005 [Ignavibacteria bacterium]
MINQFYKAKILVLVLVFVILTTSGCSRILSILSSSIAYKKEIQAKSNFRYYIYAKPSLSNIHQVDDNSFLIDSNSEASFKAPGLTSFRASFSLNFLKGDHALIYFRTLQSEIDTQYVVLDCSTSKITVKIKRTSDNISNTQNISECNYNSTDLIYLISDGKRNEIRIGCNQPIIFSLSTPQTEYLTTQTINGSSIILNDFKLESL